MGDVKSWEISGGCGYKLSLAHFPVSFRNVENSVDTQRACDQQQECSRGVI